MHLRRAPRGGLLAAVLLAGWVGLGAAGAEAPPAPVEPVVFAGTVWHTVKIEGDALFFIIRELGLRFDDRTHFTVGVRFTDEEVKSASGTYEVEGDEIVLSIPGHGKPKRVQYRRDGRDLILSNRSFDVTCRFVPGKMTPHHWF